MTLEELYTDVFQRLCESESLTAILGGEKIFDYMPGEDTKGPYVVIGDILETEGRLLSDEERGVTLRLHIWSSYSGRSEALEIKRALETTLMQDKTNYIFESFQLIRDTERWIHGVIVFRSYVEKGE